MNEQLIKRIEPELREALVGLYLRQVFQLADNELVLAFEGDDFKLLLIALDAREPRIHLIKRKLKDLKKQSQNPSKFAVDLEKALKGHTVRDLRKFEGERVVEIQFEADGDKSFLIAQLTGKSSNLFLLNADHLIIGADRKPQSEDQSIGKIYSVPSREGGSPSNVDSDASAEFQEGKSLSEQLDKHFESRAEQDDFTSLAHAALRKNKNDHSKLSRLIRNLESDLTQHGDPKRWKRFGDLLLASQTDAVRKGDVVLVRDLYDELTPLVEIRVDENDSLAEASQKYFRQYTKAKHAQAEVAERVKTIQSQLAKVEQNRIAIEDAIEAKDVDFLRSVIETRKPAAPAATKVSKSQLPNGIRSFISTDGFTILVGKKATDNDVLTFKVAQSRDTWMHAADYPGSHVVVRNPNRKDVPQRTLLEAAKLAAFYSRGKKQTKAAVNYTEKKFVNKPKGAAPGLVRLASFKTILVEPVFPNVMPI